MPPKGVSGTNILTASDPGNVIKKLFDDRTELDVLRQRIEKELKDTIAPVSKIDQVLITLQGSYTPCTLLVVLLLEKKISSLSKENTGRECEDFNRCVYELLHTGDVFQLDIAYAKLVNVLRKFSAILIQNRPSDIYNILESLNRVVWNVTYNGTGTRDLYALPTLYVPFFELCVVFNKFQMGLNMLSNRIVLYVKENMGCNAENYLLYFYYAGMIYTGCKKFEEARKAFLSCLTIPTTHCISEISILAYKKYILTSLLSSGSVQDLPSFSSNILSNKLPKMASKYGELSSTFKKGDIESFHSYVKNNEEAFRNDDNFGLVKQCLIAFSKMKIQRLTKTYITMSIADVAEKSGLSSPEKAESLLLFMMTQGEIFASIDQSNNMVTFQEDQEAFNTSKSLEKLNANIQHSIALAHILQNEEERAMLSSAYLKKMKDLVGDESKEGKGSMMAMSSHFDDDAMEEDEDVEM